jgi:hypothetical protein
MLRNAGNPSSHMKPSSHTQAALQSLLTVVGQHASNIAASDISEEDRVRRCNSSAAPQELLSVTDSDRLLQHPCPSPLAVTSQVVGAFTSGL